ncbi:hypothetical protein D3C87_1445200 [compost metagenome]
MILARIVVTTRRVDEHLAVRLAIAVSVSQQLEQRLALDLGHGIPDRHVDRADGDRPLAVAAGLLVLEHGVPHLVRVQVVSGAVDERFRVCFHDAGDEPLAHQGALSIATVGIEAITHHRLPVADHVGDHGDQAEGHLAEVDVGVADGRADWEGLLADFYDSHNVSPDTQNAHAHRRGSA